MSSRDNEAHEPHASGAMRRGVPPVGSCRGEAHRGQAGSDAHHEDPAHRQAPSATACDGCADCRRRRHAASPAA